MTSKLVQLGNRARGETSITGTGGLLPANTVIWKLHWPRVPAASSAEEVTRFAPSPKAEAEVGLQMGWLAPGQLSETLVLKFTTEVQASCALVTTISAGQVMTGGCVSRTATVKLQAAVLPAASVVVHRTVVVPTGKKAPEPGTQATF